MNLCKYLIALIFLCLCANAGERIQTYNTPTPAIAAYNSSVLVYRYPTIDHVRIRITNNTTVLNKAECLMDTGPHSVFFNKRWDSSWNQWFENCNGGIAVCSWGTGLNQVNVYNTSYAPTYERALRLYDQTTDFAGTSGCTIEQELDPNVTEVEVDKTPFVGTGTMQMGINLSSSVFLCFFDDWGDGHHWFYGEAEIQTSVYMQAQYEVIFDVP